MPPRRVASQLAGHGLYPHLLTLPLPDSPLPAAWEILSQRDDEEQEGDQEAQVKC